MIYISIQLRDKMIIPENDQVVEMITCSGIFFWIPTQLLHLIYCSVYAGLTQLSHHLFYFIKSVAISCYVSPLL